MARKKKKFELILIVLLIGIYIIQALINYIDTAITKITKSSYWEDGSLKLYLVISITMMITIIFILRTKKQKKIEKRKKEYMEQLNQVMISDKREYYIILNDDYRRGNSIENEYRKKYALELLRIYSNQCAKCGLSNNGFDLDHFIISKNEGGNFILRHKDGYLVNNAVPLCKSCNRAKSDKSYKKFYTQGEILELFKKNKEMTLIINKK